MIHPDNPWLLVAAAAVLGLCVGAMVALWWSHFGRFSPLREQIEYWRDRARQIESDYLIAQTQNREAWEHVRADKPTGGHS